MVLFVFREEYYHQMRKPLESNREKFAEWLAEGGQGARQGRGHHRQAASRADRHCRIAIRSRRDAIFVARRATTICRSGRARRACRPAWTGIARGRLNPKRYARHRHCSLTCQPKAASAVVHDRRSRRSRSRRHPDHRPLGHRRKLGGAGAARHAGGMRRRHQGRWLRLRHRAGRTRCSNAPDARHFSSPIC